MNRLIDYTECIADSVLMAPNMLPKQLKKFEPNQDNILSFLSLNIRSLRKNFNLLVAFLESLKLRISVIAVCETFLYDGEEELFQIPGYKMYAINRTKNNRSGGVAVYVMESLDSTLMESISLIHTHFDSLFIKITIKKQSHIFGTIYRSPSESLSGFIDDLEDKILDKLPNEMVRLQDILILIY